jgi:hypothetical protein
MFVFVEPGRRLRRILMATGAVTCVLELASKYLKLSEYWASRIAMRSSGTACPSGWIPITSSTSMMISSSFTGFPRHQFELHAARD